MSEVQVKKMLKVKSPGRINLIGEHTDYNDGFVLPGAIDKAMEFTIEEVDGNITELIALDINDSISFPADNLEKSKKGWANYCIGLLDLMRKKGVNVPAFKCSFGGNIPLGAGLSSSAALSCGFMYAVSEFFDLKLERLEIAKLAQKAEHEYAGVMCGIMDQYAVVFGKEDAFIQIDCRTFEHKVVQGDFSGYSVLLCDTNVKHSLASTEYNTRRQECETGVKAIQEFKPEVKSLRDATLEDLEVIKDKVSKEVIARCTYVIREIKRVEDAVEAIAAGDLIKVGQLMYETHEGLSVRYKVSCDELDVLAAFAKDHNAVIGSRMMGGGFGGCTINLVKEDQVEEFKAAIAPHYKEKTGKEVSFYDVKISNGVTAV
ncbi:galactokinase [Reichenbachiella versicolor]|uniref:galactokinase n=1 Tax=Reichenbachiella versicolor TaxID=1821036 RepID=UPI000D6DEE63|nr:galactokinase [Reichenbachiella versicolor]